VHSEIVDEYKDIRTLHTHRFDILSTMNLLLSNLRIITNINHNTLLSFDGRLYLRFKLGHKQVPTNRWRKFSNGFNRFKFYPHVMSMV